VARWSGRAGLPTKRLLGWIGLGTSKFYQWWDRYGQVNEHNGKIPRDWWLEDWEHRAILDYFDCHPLEGYRRLTFMMLDDNVVAVSPTSVYRVLKAAGRLDRHRWVPSKKGTGFEQPDSPHKHWHLDISYVNLGGAFYFLITVLDGYSRYIVHTEIRETMKESDTEVVVQRALEKYPGEHPRIIPDNGPQFIARDLAVSGTGLEGVHPPDGPDPRALVASYVDTYNHVRLHSALGYLTPADKLNGLEAVIFAERDRKLEEARLRRQQADQATRKVA